MGDPHYVTISTRLTDAQLAEVDRIAQARGQTRAATIRWLVADALGRFFISAGLTIEPSGADESQNGARKDEGANP